MLSASFFAAHGETAVHSPHQLIYPELEVQREGFGATVALTASTLAVAVPRTDGIRGEVRLFSRDPETRSDWELLTTISSPDGEHVQFGTVMALHGDTLVVAGKWERRKPNAIHVYQSRDGDWHWAGELPVPDEPSSSWRRVELALEGDTLVVGAPRHAGTRGAVFVFRRDASEPVGWRSVARLQPTGSESGDQVGARVALSGDLLAVASPHDDVVGHRSVGSVTVYARTSGTSDDWREMAVLLPEPARARQRFGQALALDGDTLVVGAHLHGLVWIYQHLPGDPGHWFHVARPGSLLAGDERQAFGAQLALSGDVLVVSEGSFRRHEHPISDRVVAEIFERDRGGRDAWERAATVLTDEGSRGSRPMVTLAGPTLALGSASSLLGSDYRNVVQSYELDRPAPENVVVKPRPARSPDPRRLEWQRNRAAEADAQRARSATTARRPVDPSPPSTTETPPPPVGQGASRPSKEVAWPLAVMLVVALVAAAVVVSGMREMGED